MQKNNPPVSQRSSKETDTNISKKIDKHAQTPLSIDTYITAATRDNTRKSYQSAVVHFEQTWGGFLPATADSMAEYLAFYAAKLAHSTLKQRLAALSVWHKEQGFPDPTKASHVKKVLKGIGELHPYKAKQAKPLQLDYIQKIIAHITLKLENHEGNRNKLIRDKALILLGFWRAFRSDELTRLHVEDIQNHPNHGLEIHLQRSKSDRTSSGRVFRVPALSTLCPVQAYNDWLHVLNKKQGAVFCSINRWGQINDTPIQPSSVMHIIQSYCKKVGIDDAHLFTSHSLRRGFANWANSHNWDVTALMKYVGWKDIHSAMRYIDQPDPFSQHHIEQGLQHLK